VQPGRILFMQERERQRVLSGAAAEMKRTQRANIKAYEEALFAEAPNKRVILSDLHAYTAVILSDLQIPFEDGAALNQALDVIRSVRPDLLVLNGDIIDCYLESTFTKKMKPDLLKDVAAQTYYRAQKFMETIADVPRKIWMGGNHEERWALQIARENERGGLSPISLALIASRKDSLDISDMHGSFAKIYNLADYGISYYPYSHRLYLAAKNLIVTHGKYVSRHSGQSAKRTLEWLGTSCIVGHTHRLGTHLVTQDGVPYGAWENGCLCQLEPEYDDSPNWQQGFSVVKVDGPEFHVIQVPIIRRNGEAVAVYHGK
jgi:predicted phosphodiesterase